MAAIRGQHLIGKMLGSCMLEKVIGYGGSSAVFLAQQQNPERKVAVKVFLPRGSMDIRMQRDFYQRFLREAKAASKLEHANILPIYSYGEQDGLPYIIMPYMSGGTFSEYLAKRGPLSLKEAQWYLAQMAAALDFAHTHGCVHCDVKPANILLDSNGQVMLSDFGIARLTQSEGDSELIESKHAEAMQGTPDYISPEQALDRPLDGRSDVYSLGVTFFLALAKRLPFRADSTLTLALMHVHEPPPSLALIRADITPLVDRVIRKSLAKDPNDRFQSAGDFSAAFTMAIAVSEKKSISAEVALLNTDDFNELPIGFLPSTSAKSSIRIKPVWASPARTSRLGRFWLIGLAFSLILVTASFTFAFVNKRSGVQASVLPTPTITVLSTVIPRQPFQFPEKWMSGPTNYFDQDKRYHMKNNQRENSFLVPLEHYELQNFKLSVTMQETTEGKYGGDFHGVIFRATSDRNHYYLFEIDLEQHQYSFLRYSKDNTAKESWKRISDGSSSAVVSERGKSNRITVEARGNAFQFAINGQPISQKPIADDAYAVGGLQSGMIGLYVEDEGEEVIFSALSLETFR